MPTSLSSLLSAPTPACSGHFHSPVAASDFPAQLLCSADEVAGAGTERAGRGHADHIQDISKETLTLPSPQGLKCFSVVPIANDHM